MEHDQHPRTDGPTRRSAWNKGKLVGAKPPLQPSHVWSNRTKLQMQGRIRDLALFNLAIDSKLRGCDVVAIRVEAHDLSEVEAHAIATAQCGPSFDELDCYCLSIGSMILSNSPIDRGPARGFPLMKKVGVRSTPNSSIARFLPEMILPTRDLSFRHASNLLSVIPNPREISTSLGRILPL